MIQAVLIILICIGVICLSAIFCVITATNRVVRQLDNIRIELQRMNNAHIPRGNYLIGESAVGDGIADDTDAIRATILPK